MKSMKGTTRNKKILIVILAALLFCAIATFGVYQILTPQRTTIYVFNDNYAAGTLVTEKMLNSVEVDSNIVVSRNRISTGDYYVTNANYKSVLMSAGVLRNDVYANYNDSTTLLLESIRVLSVGRESGAINSLTLEVDVSQSLQLIHAYTYGSIHLGLVDATGYQYSTSKMPTYNINGFTSANSN